MMFEAYDANEKLSGEVVRQTKLLTDKTALAFEVALATFFVDTVFAVWLYFGTNNWVVSGTDPSPRHRSTVLPYR